MDLNPTRWLAAEAVRTAHDPLPRDIAELATQAVLDTLACTLGGAAEPVAVRAREGHVGSGDVGVWWTDRAVDPVSAAFLNGIAAHALDYDDWMPGSGSHPSVAIVPALLAAAALTPLPGDRLLAAYVAAFELQERVGLDLGPSHYDLGFHTTGVTGALGAACAATLVMGGDAGELRHSLALAATSAAGLKSVFGSMGKPYNAGGAAAAGVRAALMARAGVEGPEQDALFGPQGLAATHSRDSHLGATSTPFGQPWYLRDLLVKLSPACFGTHAAILAARRLHAEGAVAHEVDRMRITLPTITRAVCAIAEPATGLEAKFSTAFVTAEALTGRAIDTATFAEPFHPDAEVLRLLGATDLIFDDDYPKTRTTVELTTTGGENLSADADAGLAHWTSDPVEQRPLLEAKARDLGKAVDASDSADRLVRLTAGIDRISSRDLLAVLSAPLGAAAGR